MSIFRSASTFLAAWVAVGFPSSSRAQDQEAPKNVEQSIQGSWRLVSFEQNGKVERIDAADDRTIFFAAGTFVERAKYTMKQAGTIAVDPATKPKSITIIVAQGEDRGRSFLGIYDVSKDMLKICVDRKGQSRPDKFETADHPDWSLATYTKVFQFDPNAVEIVGTYLEETPDAEGNIHKLEVRIDRRGDGYQVTWRIMGQVAYIGTGIRKNDVLSVCWVTQGQVGVSVFEIEKGPKLKGHYSMLGSPGVLVPETLTPSKKESELPKNAAGG